MAGGAYAGCPDTGVECAAHYITIIVSRDCDVAMRSCSLVAL